MVDKYDIGDKPRLHGRFNILSTGDFADPSTVKLIYTKPDGTETTLIYGVDSEVVKADVGRYYADIPVDQSGRWKFRYEGTGAIVAASENAFFVRRSWFY